MQAKRCSLYRVFLCVILYPFIHPPAPSWTNPSPGGTLLSCIVNEAFVANINYPIFISLLVYPTKRIRCLSHILMMLESDEVQ